MLPSSPSLWAWFAPVAALAADKWPGGQSLPIALAAYEIWSRPRKWRLPPAAFLQAHLFNAFQENSASISHYLTHVV